MENLLLESMAEKFAEMELKMEAIAQVVGSTDKTMTEIQKGLSLLAAEVRKRPSDLPLAHPATNTQPRFIVTETKQRSRYLSLVSLPMIVSALTLLLLCLFLTAGLRSVVIIAENTALHTERTVPKTSVPVQKSGNKVKADLKNLPYHSVDKLKKNNKHHK